MCVTCSHLRRRDLHMPFFGVGGGGGREGQNSLLRNRSMSVSTLCFSATKSPLVQVTVFHVTPNVGVVKTKYVGRDVRDHEKR